MTELVPGAKSTAAAWTRNLLVSRSDVELTFVQHRVSGTVHVIVPEDPTAELVEARPEDDEVHWLGWLTGARRAVCGYVARIHLGGVEQGDKLIRGFPDDRLCWRCHRALGEHSDRAFMHPLPEDKEEEPTQCTAPTPL